MHRNLAAEGIEVLPVAQPVQVQGLSGDAVTVTMGTAAGDRYIEGSDLLVAVGRVANSAGIGLEENRRGVRRTRVHPR
ncbi:hypothetical protein FE844_026050 (plasmid) [Rhizobium indicum]|uniref:hypothetical protein n=1 Tax=Rhizobium indicum TaxID=2583231 RepID=UPI00110732CA|nr:hypothetical protein [Rhizobium indicum]QKK33078.1 hypothetical protein FE844_026050 [Rhizobium indicum]